VNGRLPVPRRPFPRTRDSAARTSRFRRDNSGCQRDRENAEGAVTCCSLIFESQKT
jgi:hypothetical protein